MVRGPVVVGNTTGYLARIVGLSAKFSENIGICAQNRANLPLFAYILA